MRLETCIRKGLRLKAHRVREVREEDGVLVAEIERIEGSHLTCGACSRRTLQRLLGHASIKTTALYTQVSTRQIRGVTSPLDLPPATS